MPTVVLAYNGDLESMVAIHWLVHRRDAKVVVLSANIGQGIYMEPLGEAALEMGAQAAHIFDLRDRFARDFCFPALRAGAVVKDGCFLGAALERYVIAAELVRVAREENCDMVAHAFTGKGNDQIRVEMAVAVLEPDLPVLAPVREWPMKTREDLLSYVSRYELPLQEVIRQEPAYRINRNLWGTTILGGAIEDTWQEPPADVYQTTAPPLRVTNKPTDVVIGFEDGLPVSLDGDRLNPVDLIERLAHAGGGHGVGRFQGIDDRLTGLKSREVYELPTAWCLTVAHRALERLTLSREMLALRGQLGANYASLVHRGHWYSDARNALDAFFAVGQTAVTGDVRLRLHKGRADVLGLRSPNSLYDPKLATYEAGDTFDYESALGFAKLTVSPSRVGGRRRKNHEEVAWRDEGPT